jgi:aldehyde dehydrogenase (NAD+)
VELPARAVVPEAAPALLTGCSVVLKAPEETPLFGFLLAEVFAKAGLPLGVLNVVAADRGVSGALVEHPLVDKISFTGSTRAERHIASPCGA